jgi:hypothetical protein
MRLPARMAADGTVTGLRCGDHRDRLVVPDDEIATTSVKTGRRA